MAAPLPPPAHQRYPSLQSMYSEARKLFESGQIRAARSILEQLVVREPTPDALYLLGVCRFRTQDYQAAEDTFRKLLAGVPTHHLGAYYLGLSFERQGLDRESLQMYEKAVRLKPDFREARDKVTGHQQRAAGRTKTSPVPTEVPPTPSTPGNHVIGIARGVQQRTWRYTTIVAFRVHPEQGGRPVAVEMRGARLVGSLTEGDRVEVRGWRRDSGIAAKEIVNLSTNSRVKMRGENALIRLGKFVLGLSAVLILAAIVIGVIAALAR